MPYFVFVAGASGSGKTHIAERLVEIVQMKHSDLSVSLISMDNYYKPLSPDIDTPKKLKDYQDTANFDHPDKLDIELFHQQICLLAEGRSVERPVYSFKVSNRLKETVTTIPTDIIIVEGIYAHYNFDKLHRSVVKQALTVFVQSDAYLTYQERRFIRDPKERDTSVEIVREKERKFIRNSFFAHIRPAAQKFAEIFIANNYRSTDKQEVKEKARALLEQQLLELVVTMADKAPELSWSGADELVGAAATL